MKKLIAIIALWSMLPASASEAPDTVATLYKATGVTVDVTDTDVRIKVSDSGSREWLDFSSTEVSVDSLDSRAGAMINFSLPFARETVNRRFQWIGAKDIFCEYSMPAAGSDCVKAAYTFGIGALLGVRWWTSTRTTLDLGLGFQSTYRSLKDGYSFSPSADGSIRAVHGISGTDPARAQSRLVTSDFLVSVYLTQRLSRSFALRLSVMACFDAYSYATNRYIVDGVQYTEKITNLQRCTLVPEFSAGLGWAGWIGLYVKYNPCPLFKKGYGPDFSTVSAGVSLAY